jgi:hypothetical protein
MPDYSSHVAPTPSRRSPLVRAARSNDPLMLPAGIDARSPAGRRWNDLAAHYSQQIGPQRLAFESTRAKLTSLLWLTLQLERARDATKGDCLPIHTMLHLAQEQRVLISELGLDVPVTVNRDYVSYR